MLELIETFTPLQIICYAVGLTLAVKGAWDLIDFFKNKYAIKFNKDYSKKKQEELLEEYHNDSIKQHEETIEMHNSLEHKIDELTEVIDTRLTGLEESVDRLTVSDMHDIKQSIVRSFHYFVEQQGWIDDFSLDTLELRFSDYLAENGNSYAAGLMSEIRQLPKHPPVS